MQEIWKDIQGYEGLYQISNLGIVKSLSRKILTYGKRSYICKEKKLSIIIDKWGYSRINMFKNKKIVVGKIHRLVAQAFIPNPDNKPCVNHKNGIKHDNRVENLEWVTHSENTIHSFKILGHRVLVGENHPKPNLGKFGKNNKTSKKVNQYTKEGKFIKLWYSISDVTRELGIKQNSICNNLSGISKTSGGFIWKYIKESN